MIARTLAEFTRHSAPPDQALAVLRLSLLDWCAVGLFGRNEPVSRILRDQALDEGGTEQASLIGHNQAVPARMAALVNGTTSHALDYDDTHFAHIGHPSVVVIPAAMAVAQLCGVSGADMQDAALIGAEASIRVGLWLGRGHYQAGFHQTSTAGAFGATLAAARLLALDPDQTAMALGLVSTMASGLKSQFGTMGKPMNAGIAAAGGVEAALLAQRGFVSNPGAADGAQGFGPSHHGEGNIQAFDRLGQDWLFEDVSHKYHACCHGLHAMLEALTPVLSLDAGQIAQVEITTHPRWLSVCNITRPATGLEAKFSYTLTAAMRLLGHDTGQPESFTDALCCDAEIMTLREKTEVIASEHLSETEAEVRIIMQDGAVQNLSYDLNTPQPFVARQERILAKAASLLGNAPAERLWQMILIGAPPGDLMAELSN